MTAQLLARHTSSVDAPPCRRAERPGSDLPQRCTAGTRRWLITAGVAAGNGLPTTMLAMSIHHVAVRALITVAALDAFIVACAAISVIYPAWQQIRRKQLDVQARNGLAGAFSACVNDVHRHADDPADTASAAEAKRVRDSARAFLTDHRENLTRLTDRPQP